MLSQQEISDRLEILDLLARYCAAIDSRRWDDLDAVFTPDAVIDYSEMGGIRGSLGEQKDFLDANLPAFAGFQHLVGSTVIDIDYAADADTAAVRSICFNPMVVADEKQVLFCGLWYRDEIVRTPQGWRIRSRHEDRGWSLDVRR